MISSFFKATPHLLQMNDTYVAHNPTSAKEHLILNRNTRIVRIFLGVVLEFCSRWREVNRAISEWTLENTLRSLISDGDG
jgi:hypothetical protein